VGEVRGERGCEMAGDYSGWMYEYELNVRDRVMIIRAICRYGMGHIVNLETDPSLNVFQLVLHGAGRG
jgi:hypothetical protein